MTVNAKEHSEDLRKRVMACHFKGAVYDKISKTLNFPNLPIDP